MVEPLAFERGGAGGYGVDGDVDRICALVRQAAELGADIIKADPTDDLSEYHRVITVARVPLLVRGGGRVTDEEILERTHAVLEQGARRDRLRAQRHPARRTRAAMTAALHGGGARRRTPRTQALATLQ